MICIYCQETEVEKFAGQSAEAMVRIWVPNKYRVTFGVSTELHLNAENGMLNAGCEIA